jgi:hypothetical protein
MKKIIICVLTLVLAVLMGCATLSDGLTPCVVSDEAALYAEQEKTDILPYSTLSDAYRISWAMDYRHMITQMGLARKAEDDRLYYDYLNEYHDLSMKSAENLKRQLFDPQGGIVPGLMMASGFGIGWLGLKRPGDVPEKEHKEKVNTAGHLKPDEFKDI